MSMHNKKPSKYGRILFHTIALTILILILGINFDHQAQTVTSKPSAWYLQEVGQIIQYRTSILNQSNHSKDSTWIGINNKPQQCEQNIFMLKFQSQDPTVKSLAGQKARMQIIIGKKAASITLPIQVTHSEDGQFDIWLTNFVISEQLNKDMANHSTMTIRLLDPDVLIEAVPVTELQFSLAGFVQTQSIAESACYAMNNAMTQTRDVAMARYAIR